MVKPNISQTETFVDAQGSSSIYRGNTHCRLSRSGSQIIKFMMPGFCLAAQFQGPGTACALSGLTGTLRMKLLLMLFLTLVLFLSWWVICDKSYSKYKLWLLFCLFFLMRIQNENWYGCDIHTLQWLRVLVCPENQLIISFTKLGINFI